MRNDDCKGTKATGVRQAFRQISSRPPIPSSRRRSGRGWLMLAAVAVLVVATPYVWLDVQVSRARSQRLAAQTVVRLGGQTYYEHQVDKKFHIYSVNPYAPSPHPAWVTALLGEDLFSHVSAVDLQGRTHVCDADLAVLRHFPWLKFVDLTDVPDVSSDGLAHLRSLDQLERVVLTSSKVTGAALAHLRNLPRLEVLCLLNAQLDDEDLTQLLDLPRLEVLVVSTERISQKAAEAFMSKRPRCEVVRLADFPKHLLPQLEFDAQQEARIESDHRQEPLSPAMVSGAKSGRNTARLGVSLPRLIESARALGVR